MPTDRNRRLSRPSRPGAVVAVLACSGLTASFMQTVLIPIQSELPRLLDAVPADTAWVITVTVLVSAIFTPISGRLGDMYGKRRVVLALLGLLISGSIVAALSASLLPLLVGRALQGAGMGVIPLGISILRDTLPRRHLTSSIALVSATLGIGGALGLPFGAAVTEQWDWRIVFWISALLGATCLCLVFAFIPVSVLRTGGRFDFVGAAGLCLGLVGVLLAVSRGNEWGWLSGPTLVSAVGGLVVLALWGLHQLRRTDPLVDLRVSSRAPVLITNLASVAMGFALFASTIVFPQLLQLPAAAGGGGMSLVAGSLILVPSGIAMLVASPFAGIIERRYGPRILLTAGAVVIAIAYLLAVIDHSTVLLILVVNTAIGAGIGLGYAAMPALIMRAVPASETGAAMGLNTLMRSLGTSTAAAGAAAALSASAVRFEGKIVPSETGIEIALLSGLIAASICALLSLVIPNTGEIPGEHRALPPNGER